MPRFYATLTTVLWLFLLLVSFAPALRAQSPGNAGNSSPQNLSCSPAPCVLPNLRLPGRNLGGAISSIVVNPNNSGHMLVSVSDGTCSSFIGFYSPSAARSTC